MKKHSLFLLFLLVSSVLNAQLKVNSSGNIEIGTSPTTSYKLNLAGTSNFNGASYFSGTSNFSNGMFYYTGPSTIYGPQFNVVGTNSFPGMYISAASTFTGTYLLYVNGTIGAAEFEVNSDSQLKKNIAVLDGKEMLSKIMSIDGKKYEYKENNELELLFEAKNPGYKKELSYNPINLPKGERIGFIAQEIEKEFPELVTTDSITNLKSINYDGMIPILLQSIKEQQYLINQLQEKINGVSVTPKQSLLRSSSNNNEPESNTSNTLFQNIPNPFTNSTIINYYLTGEIINAMICIYNMNGNQLKSYILSERGNGKITIKGSELSAGMYMYALIVDGKEVDTKKMILTK